MSERGEHEGSAADARVVTHTGPHMALGYDGGGYCIWDREASGPPLLRFPLTDEGWARAWEEFTRLEEGEAIQTEEAEPPSQPPIPASADPTRTDPGATASVVLGLVGVLPLGVFSITAFVLAAQARRRVERGESRGGRLAIVGMVLAILGMGWTALFAMLVVTISSCGFLDAPPDAPAWCGSGAVSLAMWGGIWAGQLLLAIAFAPKSPKLWKETGVAVGMVAAIVAVFVLIAVVNATTKSNHPKAIPSFPENVGGAPLPTLGVTVMGDDFSDPTSGWHQETADSFSFGYVRGEYQITVEKAGEHRYWVRAAPSGYQAVRVAADVRRGSGIEGTFGILCESNNEDQDGYLFLIDPDSGTFEVRRLIGGYTFILAGGRSGAILSGSRPNSLEGYCDHGVAGQPTVLTFSVNGTRVVQTQDDSFSRFTGIGMYAESDSGATDARFDNLVMSA